MTAMRSIFCAVLAFLWAAPLAAAPRYFVDNQLGTVKPEEKVSPALPAPVQVVFEFQRDGVPNPKAAAVVKPWALEAIRGSGNFSEVSEAAAANGAVLNVRFNNFADKVEFARRKSSNVRRDLSLGLFGSKSAKYYTDHYDVVLEYVAAPGAAAIRTTVGHRLYTSFGKKGADTSAIPGTPYDSGDEAVRTLVVQALERGLNSIFSSAGK